MIFLNRIHIHLLQVDNPKTEEHNAKKRQISTCILNKYR